MPVQPVGRVGASNVSADRAMGEQIFANRSVKEWLGGQGSG